MQFLTIFSLYGVKSDGINRYVHLYLRAKNFDYDKKRAS